MTVVSIKDLDAIRAIESYLKGCVSFAIPKFITRNIAVLVMKSNSLKVACKEIYFYLTSVAQQGIVKNANLLGNINKIFLDIGVVKGLWESAHNIDYAKLALEKKALLGEERNDKYELSQNKNRGLTDLLRSGISIKINVSTLKDIQKKPSCIAVPLIEYYSNYRLLQINNFSHSKLSHLVHDLFDHLYFFSELDKEQFFSLSSSFWCKVGNPQERDVFSRESELIASIAYERRYYLQNQEKFNLCLNNAHISAMVSKAFGAIKNEYIDKIEYITRKNISVYHIYYNVICELYEQIRKVGAIKLINDKGEFEGDITMMLKNDYLKVIIDVLYFIAHKETQLKKMLLKIYSYIESLIYNSLNSSLIEYNLVINLSMLKTHSIRRTKHVANLKNFFNL